MPTVCHLPTSCDGVHRPLHGMQEQRLPPALAQEHLRMQGRVLDIATGQVPWL